MDRSGNCSAGAQAEPVDDLHEARKFKLRHNLPGGIDCRNKSFFQEPVPILLGQNFHAQLFGFLPL